jgi:tetratricopeptide (TPR) repeat protein
MRAMRSTLLLLLLGFNASLPAMDRSAANALVEQAQQAYAQGGQEQALALFDSVNTRFTSAGLLFNIANCHFKLQRIPHAILHYERALRLAPGNEDIQNNLELARMQIVDRVNEMPRFSVGNELTRLSGGRDADQWARWVLWTWAITLLLLALGLVIKEQVQRRMLFSLSAVAFLAVLVCTGFAAVRAAAIHDSTEAILMSARIDVRSEPREGSTTLFVLHKGTKVEVLQELDQWVEVALRNGSVGWVPMQTIERI